MPSFEHAWARAQGPCPLHSEHAVALCCPHATPALPPCCPVLSIPTLSPRLPGLQQHTSKAFWNKPQLFIEFTGLKESFLPTQFLSPSVKMLRLKRSMCLRMGLGALQKLTTTTARRSTVQHGAAQHSTLQHSTAQRSVMTFMSEGEAWGCELRPGAASRGQLPVP